MIYMFLSNNPSSGDINSSNLSCSSKSLFTLTFDRYYVGHPISSDNGLIYQKLLLKSEFNYPLHVAMGVAYSCLEYGVFITT